MALVTACGGAERPQEIFSTRDRSAKVESLTVIDNAVNTRTFHNRLFELASTTVSETREQVAMAVGRIGDAKGIPILVKLMSDSEPTVRRHAAFAASQFEKMPSLTLLNAVRKRLEKEPSTDVLTAAIFASSKIEPASQFEARVSTFLDDPRPPIRIAALEALGRLAMRGESISPKAADAVEKALLNPLDTVRVAAAFASGAASGNGPHLVSTLTKALLWDSSAEVRIFAAKALVKRGAFNDALLFAALDDQDYRVGVGAMEALPRLPDKERCDLVSKGLLRMAERVQEAPKIVSSPVSHLLYAALVSSTQCAASEPIKRNARKLADALEMAATTTTGMVDPLRCLALRVFSDSEIEILSCHSSDPGMGKLMLIERLARTTPYTEMVETALQELVRDSDLRVATAAVRALLRCEYPSLEKRVLPLLSDDRAIVVSEALHQISAHPKRFLDPLRKDEPAVYSSLLSAIHKVVMRFKPFDHAIMPLIYSAKALGAIHQTDVEPILRQLAVDVRPSVRESALAAYGAMERWSRPAGLPPIELSDTPSPWHGASHVEGRDILTTFETSIGVFTMALFSQTAPRAVMSFVNLAKSGYYNQTPIPYASGDLVIHSGDPTSTGFGDPGYSVTSEKSTIPFERGTVGMSPLTDNSIGARFFITLSRRPDMDGRYVALGRIASNVSMLDSLESGAGVMIDGVLVSSTD